MTTERAVSAPFWIVVATAAVRAGCRLALRLKRSETPSQMIDCQGLFKCRGFDSIKQPGTGLDDSSRTIFIHVLSRAKRTVTSWSLPRFVNGFHFVNPYLSCQLLQFSGGFLAAGLRMWISLARRSP